MVEQTTVLRGLGAEDAIAWGRHVRGRVSTVKRVVHFYVVDEGTGSMYCVSCGLNIVATKYGEVAVEAASRALDGQNERCCGE